MKHISAFLEALRAGLGAGAVDTAEETLARYGRNLLPGGDRRPSAVAYPASTLEVQQIVRLANEYHAPLYSISTGENRGLGLKSPLQPGCLVVDVGARMNRILEIDETLCFAAIEPGVTYQQMYDELGRRGHTLMMDTTSGPPTGGIVGNTLDKGAGYSPYFDHFGMSCGLEVVLGDGRLLRTADGALPDSHTWHIAKYGYGPFLDGLFLQSNFGIVTRMGVWLMPRPPAIRSFFFMFPDDEDFAEIIELIRPLKLNNVVPSLLKVTSELYGLGTVTTYPFERTDGRTPLPDVVRRELQREYGVGAWCVSGAFYGVSDDILLPLVERMKTHFGRSGKARYISHEEAVDNHILKIHLDTFTGTPTTSELSLLNWRPGGGNCWFLPAMPMIGSIANQQQALSRRILREHQLEFITEYVCGARMARALHVIVFNRQDPQECQRVIDCYRALMAAYAEAGYPISRAPLDFQDEAMQRLDTFPEVCRNIKHALDPNAILSPGRYGIRYQEDPMAELFHVGLTVKNLERSLAFYRDVVGMKEHEWRMMNAKSKEFDTLTNNPGAELKVAHLTLGPFMLQLIEYVAGGGTTLDLHHNNVGSPHLCIYVPDVEAKLKELQQRGDVTITSGLVQITPTMRSFYTEDPDGVPVEFLQATK